MTLLIAMLLVTSAFGYPGETPSYSTIQGGNIKLQNNEIISTNVDGDISLTPNGDGSVLVPTVDPGDNSGKAASTAYVLSNLSTIKSWETLYGYLIGDVVTESSKIYRANTAHISDVFLTDIANWDELGGGDTVSDADATTKGILKLAGDLSGTADEPTVPALANKAPIESPIFTGAPKAPTPAPLDNSTKIATTEYVEAAVISGISGGATYDAVSVNNLIVPSHSFSNPVKLPDPSVLPAVSTTILFKNAWSSNGRFLSVAHNLTPFITIYERDGTTFTKLADPGTLPTGGGRANAWAPDARFLSVAHATTPFVTIYERDGTTFTKLADPSVLPTSTAVSVAWSSNGRFLSVGYGTTPFVNIYERNKTTFTKLADPAVLPPGVANGVAWSSDGRFLSVAHATTPFITIYERNGTTFTKLTDPSVLPASAGVSVAWSSNGRFLSVAHATTPFITIYERDGTTFTKLSDPAVLPVGAGRDVAWTSNDRFLSVGHQTTPFITIYERDGTTFTKLSDPAVLPPNNATGVAWSTDGRFLSVVNTTTSPFITNYETSSPAPDIINKFPLVKGKIGE
jgi:6-phosphogluconolactonase (cycloisomerase 2 family)